MCGGSSKPLVLVLTSYEALQWTVNVPNGVTIERILVVSSYLILNDYLHIGLVSVMFLYEKCCHVSY